MSGIESGGSNTRLKLGLVCGGAVAVGVFIFCLVFCAAKSTNIERGARRLVCWPGAPTDNAEDDKYSNFEENLVDPSSQDPRLESVPGIPQRDGHEGEEAAPKLNNTVLTTFADIITPPQSYSNSGSPTSPITLPEPSPVIKKRWRLWSMKISHRDRPEGHSH